jgi:hypothetical protein
MPRRRTRPGCRGEARPARDLAWLAGPHRKRRGRHCAVGLLAHAACAELERGHGDGLVQILGGLPVQHGRRAGWQIYPG